MRDPKLGWHTLWITPLAVAVCGASIVAAKCRDIQHKRKMSRILKDPDINDLSKLSGVLDND